LHRYGVKIGGIRGDVHVACKIMPPGWSVKRAVSCCLLRAKVVSSANDHP
jgi:hypothetical protein